MMERTPIPWINYLCLLPFVALLGSVVVADDWLTNTGIGKNIAFYIVMLFVPLATGLAFWNNREVVKFHGTDYFVLAWVLTAFAFSGIRYEEISNRMTVIVMLAMLYYCFRIFLLQHALYIRILMLTAVFFGAVEAVWGLCQLYGLVPSKHALYGVTGSFFNPGPYAGYLAVILPIALFYLLWKKPEMDEGTEVSVLFEKAGRAIAGFCCITIVLILPATWSRAAWIAAAVGCIVVLWRSGYLRYIKPAQGKKRFLLKGVTLTIVSVSMLGIALGGLYHLKKDSADGRALIWKMNVKMISHTWYGTALGYYGGGYARAQEAYFRSGEGSEREALLAGEPAYAFNEFLQITAEQGVAPALFLLLAVLVALYTGLRKQRYMAVGALLALLAFAFFSYPFSLMPFLILLVFLLTACNSAPYVFEQDFFSPYTEDTRERWNGYVLITIMLLSMLYTGGVVYKRYPVYKAHQIWGKNKVYYQAGMYQRVVDESEPIERYLWDQPDFLFAYGRSLFKLGKYRESLLPFYLGGRIRADPMFWVMSGRSQEAWKMYDMAIKEYEFAANLGPNRLYPLYLLAKLYDKMGEDEQAYKTALKVMQKKVKIQSPAVDEMRAEMREYLKQYKAGKRSKKDEPKKRKKLGIILVH